MDRRGERRERGLELDALADAAARLDCAPARSPTLDALAAFLRPGDGRRVVGLDFPFSLPRPLLDGDDWRAFVRNTPDEWGRLDAGSPRMLYNRATETADREGFSLRRATDERRGGQPPTGFRIKTQTYYGISGVLRRVLDDVAVAPMDAADAVAAAGTVLVEAYPAALFEAVGGARSGYKRDTREGIETRARNAERLRTAAGVDLGDHRHVAAATDDALDAVAAAVAAWRAARTGFAVDGDHASGGDAAVHRVEGHIYA